MIPVTRYGGQKVAVLGLGRSGLASAAALAAGGASVLCWDDSEDARQRAAAQGYDVVDLARAGALEECAALILSPGVAHLYPKPNKIVTLAHSAGVPVDNDIGLFFSSFASADWDYFDSPPRVVAVTGSNGKSTTSALIHHILGACGRKSQLGGNIGVGALSLDPPEDGEIIILELSSYQTELARALTPDIAVFTNLSADHLDRHGGMGGYFAAKRRLFAEGGPDRAIIGVDEAEGSFLAAQIAQGREDDQVIRLSSRGKVSHGWSVVTKKGFLAETRKGHQAASIDLRAMPGLQGNHNHQNAAAAYAVARVLGLGPRQIEPALASFAGLPHRAQLIGQKDGVQFINDSKATNAASAARSLSTYKGVRWIAGGQAKEGGLSDVVGHLDNVTKAYLIGECAKEFADALGPVAHEICGDLQSAFAACLRDVEPGECVLLAPAAASFDQFDSFEARGDAFAALVRAHIDG